MGEFQLGRAEEGEMDAWAAKEFTRRRDRNASAENIRGSLGGALPALSGRFQGIMLYTQEVTL